MINNAAFPPVGILGLGFLGQILAREFSAVPESWGTWHLTPPPEPILSNFSFDWANENNWSALPEIPVTLVLTIPPLLKNPETEAERLHLWGKWMNHNRPELKSMIYMSTTGVYPKRNGIWSEDSDFEADTNSGKLRLVTENILSKYFSLQVVRPGGIYGYGRGIDVRLKSGKPIPVSNTPVHRIHVMDLARINLGAAGLPFHSFVKSGIAEIFPHFIKCSFNLNGVKHLRSSLFPIIKYNFLFIGHFATSEIIRDNLIYNINRFVFQELGILLGGCLTVKN